VARTVTGIAVRNQDGDEFTLFEIWEPRGLFGFVADYRLELPTGEKVEELDHDHFVVMATGERLTRAIE
jgi:hypothetical protein